MHCQMGEIGVGESMTADHRSRTTIRAVERRFSRRRLLPCLVAAGALTASTPTVVVAQECVDPPPDMVAWWPLDEPVGPIAYDIIGGKHGTHMNGPVCLPGGKVSGALSFDGIDDYVEGWDGDGSLEFGMGEGTIDAWIRTTDTDYAMIFARGSHWWSYWLHIRDDGRPGFDFCDDGH